MYFPHPLFEGPWKPKPDQKIWRFMDFTKFVWMLETSTLHFTRVDCFKDKFEGTIPAANFRKYQQIRSGTSGETGAKPLVLPYAKLASWTRSQLAVNCWHANDHESAAMWRLYLKSDEGIAVQSTVERLTGSFDPNDKRFHVFVGMVGYNDYEVDEIPYDSALRPTMFKRKSFEHEKELRAVAYRTEIEESEGRASIRVGLSEFEKQGIDLRILDYRCLISRVYVAPGTSDWFFELVKLTAKRHGLQADVHRSSLDDDPIW